MGIFDSIKKGFKSTTNVAKKGIDFTFNNTIGRATGTKSNSVTSTLFNPFGIVGSTSSSSSSKRRTFPSLPFLDTKNPTKNIGMSGGFGSVSKPINNITRPF